jgi:hypothetical protein
LSAFQRRRLAATDASSAHAAAGLYVTVRIGTMWDLRGRTAAGKLNFTSSADVCHSLTTTLSDELLGPDQGGAFVAAVRAAAVAAGVPGLASTSVNASLSTLPSACNTTTGPLPTPLPTPLPSPAPTPLPSAAPTPEPSPLPSPLPTPDPTFAPTPEPTHVPTSLPTATPTELPTEAPTPQPSEAPSPVPTDAPTPVPTSVPTSQPTQVLRGYQQCVCVTAGVARKLKAWCPNVAPHFDGESCLSNVTTAELYELVADCPPLQTTFFADQ